MEEKINKKNILKKLEFSRPRLKIIGITFFGIFTSIWLLLEPLNVFGIGEDFLLRLGIEGYFLLVFASISISLFIELIYMYSKFNKNKCSFEEELEILISEHTKLRLLTDVKSVIKANIEILTNAKAIIAISGSRSRDISYLKQIEQKLIDTPDVIHYRVLWKHPHNSVLKKHLLELIKIRNPMSRELGEQKLFIGLFDNSFKESEKFVCTNEEQSLIILPSIHGISNYDTALLIEDREIAYRMIQYVKELYSSGNPIENYQKIMKLKILRSKTTDAVGK
ncbi:hypothetical protein JYT34_00530 [Olleya sp. AH-315-K02]|nr:hypothetical protein [bacterium AH-315-P13]MBN4057909.1 hypothetical protein [Olleya sp. AH-315-K02]